MKTSVKSIMMSLALMGCLIFSASDAIAQGRGHSQGGGTGSNSNRNTNVSTGRRDDNNTTSSSSSSSIRTGDATARPGTSTPSGSGNGGNSVKPDNGGKPGNGGANTNPGPSPRPNDGGNPSVAPRPNDSGNPGTSPWPNDDVNPGTSPRPIEEGPSVAPRPIDDGPGMLPPPNDGAPDMPPLPDYGGPDILPPPKEFIIGYGPMNSYDYSCHHYSSEFSWNYENHNWSSSLPPLARDDRPSFRGWFRPMIPAGWSPKSRAPMVDGILGIPFGTLFDDVLDFLYCNGYFIDGYAKGIIYLRNVPMLRMIWDDVMLAFDAQGRLVNAEFVINTYPSIAPLPTPTHPHYGPCYNGSTCRTVSYDDNGITPNRTVSADNNGIMPIRTVSRDNDGSKYYDRVYKRLSQIFGTPFNNKSGSVSVYGGNNTGWITLLTYSTTGCHHTMLSIGY